MPVKEELEKDARKDKNQEKEKENEIDIYRDTPVRLLGYANEVGESFRALIHVRLVHASYVVASGYVLMDTLDKVKKVKKIIPPTDPTYNRRITSVAMDTLLWQSLASVMIPGFTINRICASSLYLFRKFSKLPINVQKWTTTAIGLGCIPFIVKPIDKFVDILMDNSVRAWFDTARKSGPSH
ncbi:mitochondrial fission process protein 1-like [Centruroides sculpturatus]|uniref:mitochondrial fission process protein 1-like n=1 Tax=Centruroides sculpturatus TaxID=218467 RepID=UPI000C6E6B42|nr:mitochondrial fission process protein 1-like [Centruroides sculpturatus]